MLKPDRTARLEALGSYQKHGASLDDVEALAATLKAESDRGCVIILVSFVEDALFERILSQFPSISKAEKKNLARSGAPLNSLAARVQIAKAMGLLTSKQAEMLEVLKAMRNACAHSRQEISFATPELRDVFQLVFDVDGEDPFQSLTSEHVRSLFIIMVGALLQGVTSASGDPLKAGHFRNALDVVSKLSHERISTGDLLDAISG